MQKIRQIISQYGEENFYISFSGGKDSTVLSALVDMALPRNEIPRVYADTGIELNMVRNFVLELQKTDSRVVVIRPAIPIKRSLEEQGYPFKSKLHAHNLERLNRIGMCDSIKKYLGESINGVASGARFTCPKKLRYQFDKSCKLKISDKCCVNLKEKPLDTWSKKNDRPYTILGLMREEGGRRNGATCLSFRGKKLRAFQPMVTLIKEWEEWFINEFNIRICDIYKPPYNFTRTGCKGCPFALKLQDELDVLAKFFPAERKQCEAIWKPVYEEYRRLGYRLKGKQEN
nr:phosphoadenosine phosphosulfate reductase family protein [uncultured Oribacterium sp.]